MRLHFFICLVVALVVSHALAATPVEDLRKTVEERCARVQTISMAGGMFYSPTGSGSWGDEIEFRFDRPTRRLIVWFSDRPVLYVQSNRVYFLLGQSGDDPNQHFIYLEVPCDHTTTWKDLDAARRLMKQESKDFGFSPSHFCEPFEDALASLVAPFIEGGLDYLVPANAQPLPYDARLLASDPEKTAERIAAMKLSEFAPGIFILGHPDSKLLENPDDKPKPLAPRSSRSALRRTVALLG